MKTKRNILVLDDDEINLTILNKGVRDEGHNEMAFLNSTEAWEFMKNNPEKVDIAILDKMMPEIDGIELLKRMKEHPDLCHIPVIIQTGDVGVEQMRDGLHNGAFYYLTKPYHPDILRAIMESAVRECKTMEEIAAQGEEGNSRAFFNLLQQAQFKIRTHSEAESLAAALSEHSAYPEYAVVGLLELLYNAIEHGNLAIGYEQKRSWVMAGEWDEKLAERIASDEYKEKYVQIDIKRNPEHYYVMIKDQGHGFDWHTFLDKDGTDLKLNEPNGRGIAKADIMVDGLRYVGNGSEVDCNIRLNMPESSVESARRSKDISSN